MTDIDDAIDDVRDAATDFLNSEGRSAGHVAIGVALTVGFALLATGIASGALRPKRNWIPPTGGSSRWSTRAATRSSRR